MDNERQTLEEKVDELTKTLDRLEDECLHYQMAISRMTTCKLTDPRHPFTDWELFYLQNEDAQKKFRAVMKTLQNRLEGKETPIAEQTEVDGIPKEVLYGASKPSYLEIVDTLKRVGRQDNTGLIEVMKAIKDEYEVDLEFGVLADFVLEGVHLSGGGK
jgi:hypothetical protein